jgi:hypothetical protein
VGLDNVDMALSMSKALTTNAKPSMLNT